MKLKYPHPWNKNHRLLPVPTIVLGICYEPRVVLPSKRADPSMIGGCNPNVSMEITRSPAK